MHECYIVVKRLNEPTLADLAGVCTGGPDVVCVTESQAAQAHYVWVRASEVIWSEYTRIISVLSDAK